MIEKLQNKNIEMSKKIHSLFQISYTMEAKLLNTKYFPPLNRLLENYVESSTVFFGYLKNEKLVGIIEIDHNDNQTQINSLVVDPKFFRQGIARKLMEFVFETFDSNLFVVETGVKNKPASELYKKLDFKEVKQWNTDFGIKKIKFERRINKN